MAYSRSFKLGSFEVQITHRRSRGYTYRVIFEHKVICQTSGFMSDSAADKAAKDFITKFNLTRSAA